MIKTFYEEKLTEYTNDIILYYAFIQEASNDYDIRHWKRCIHTSIKNFVKRTGMLI